MVPCKSTAEEVSFELSHHRISSRDSKVRTTLHVFITDLENERFSNTKSKLTIFCSQGGVSPHRLASSHDKSILQDHEKKKSHLIFYGLFSLGVQIQILSYYINFRYFISSRIFHLIFAIGESLFTIIASLAYAVIFNS